MSIDKCRCSDDGKHRFEASAVVYLDLDEINIVNDEVIIDAMSPSHVNDKYGDQYVSVEEMTVSCADCGEEFDWSFSQEGKRNLGLQPIGNAPRTFGGVRAGMPDRYSFDYSHDIDGGKFIILDGGMPADNEDLYDTEEEAQERIDLLNATD